MSSVFAVLATEVYSAIPYYNGYEWPAAYYDTRLFEWTAGAAPVATAGDPVIEIITAPNNPDGAMRNKTIKGSFIDRSACMLRQLLYSVLRTSCSLVVTRARTLSAAM